MENFNFHFPALTWARDANDLLDPHAPPLPLALHPNLLQNATKMWIIWCFQDTIEITGTFKHRKMTLVEEGFNPAVIKDALYFLDDTAKMYVPMTEDIYNAISAKTLKLWIFPGG